MISRARLAIAHDGRRDKKDNRTMPAPMVAMTSNMSTRKCGSKNKPKLTIVNSIRTSVRPRVKRKRRPAALSGVAWSESQAEVPERKTKAGAQRWVIHRVKKISGVVV